MHTNRRFDYSLVAIVALLVVQASVASYGLRLVRTVASVGHDRIAAVVDAGR